MFWDPLAHSTDTCTLTFSHLHTSLQQLAHYHTTTCTINNTHPTAAYMEIFKYQTFHDQLSEEIQSFIEEKANCDVSIHCKDGGKVYQDFC